MPADCFVAAASERGSCGGVEGLEVALEGAGAFGAGCVAAGCEYLGVDVGEEGVEIGDEGPVQWN